MKQYNGSCLCGATTYSVKNDPTNPHLCSCKMCQKSSGALTVAWVEFMIKDFEWTGRDPALYKSSSATKRCFCKDCGCLFGAINKGSDKISITIASLEDLGDIKPSGHHSFEDSAPDWWKVKIY